MKRSGMTIGIVGSMAFTTVIFTVITGAMVVSADWPYEARLLPWVVGIPAALLCLFLIAQDIWRARRSAAPEERVALMDIQADDDLPTAEVVRRGGIMFAWIFGLFVAVWLFGFLPVLPVFIVLYMTMQGGERWLFSIFVALSMMACAVIIFHYLLHVAWLRGVFRWPQDLLLKLLELAR